MVACLYLNIGHTQTTEDSVKQTITNLFVAMKSSDRNFLQSVFADSAILQTIGHQKSTGVTVRNQQVSAFIEQVSRLPANAADERITFDLVKVDADLASVWTPYQFYYNGDFSHCGVNSFQLVRIKGEWKIQYLIDTRRKDKCIE